MMMFNCQQWWWLMAENFASPLKAVQGARKMKPNDSMMYSGSWWAGFLGQLGRIFAWKKPPKEGISTMNYAGDQKKQLPGLPQFMLILGFSWTYIQLSRTWPISFRTYPFMKLIYSLPAPNCQATCSSQRILPGEVMAGRNPWGLKEATSQTKKERSSLMCVELMWHFQNLQMHNPYILSDLSLHAIFIHDDCRVQKANINNGLTLAPRTATVAFSSSSKAKCLCPCICWLHQCANQNAGPGSGWIPSLKLT